MLAPALEALLGGEPTAEVVEAALATIPIAELPAALRGLARAHGAEAVPVLARCLAGRPEWVEAAAGALGGLAIPAAAVALQAAESRAPTRAARAAVRRGLYRLRQAGVPSAAPSPSAGGLPPSRFPARPVEAWMSPIDGTGSRGVWLLIEGRLGAHTLLRGVVSDTGGLLEGAAGPVAKRRAEHEVATLGRRDGLQWVAVPPAWSWAVLARALGKPDGSPAVAGRRALARAQGTLGPPPMDADPPRRTRLADAELDDPALLERSGALLELPEFAGWFLDPPTVQAAALDLLQTRESRLVVSDQVKAEREAALVDRVIEAELDPPARARWAARLDEQAFVLHETGRPAEGRAAAATARALANPDHSPRRLPFVRALVERSLAVAAEVALGRVAAATVSRTPRPR